MRVKVTQSGGYAGIPIELGAVDTAQGGEKGERVSQLLRQANFFQLPAAVEGGGMIGADFPEYEISVQDGSRSNTVRFRDDGSPQTEPLRSLVQAVAGG